MKYDMRIVGPSFNKEYDTAASATALKAGEPVLLGGTYSSGAASSNYASPLTDGKPVIGTDSFGGVASKDATHTASVAGKVSVAKVYPFLTEIWGKAKVTGSVNTVSELLGVIFDVTLFDLTSSVYTIDETASADTSGLRIEDGNPAKGELGVTVDSRALRNDIS